MDSSGSGQQRHPIAAVQDGMHVVDSAGEEIGTVEFVKMGDPDAVTSQGQLGEDGSGLAADISRAFGGTDEPDVPEGLAERLVRAGFVKIDGKGLFARDFYASADEVADVIEDTVRLSTTREQLTRKG
jgi:hypothetical protein